MGTGHRRLLHEELKLKEKLHASDGRRALTVMRGNPRKLLTCHFCKRPGHLKRDCRKFLATQKGQKQKESASTAKTESDSEALVTTHALCVVSRRNWIVDSGATCNMCNDRKHLSEMKLLESLQDVTLGEQRVFVALKVRTEPPKNYEESTGRTF